MPADEEAVGSHILVAGGHPELAAAGLRGWNDRQSVGVDAILPPRVVRKTGRARPTLGRAFESLRIKHSARAQLLQALMKSPAVAVTSIRVK